MMKKNALISVTFTLIVVINLNEGSSIGKGKYGAAMGILNDIEISSARNISNHNVNLFLLKN